jgi:hypothetical protein
MPGNLHRTIFFETKNQQKKCLQNCVMEKKIQSNEKRNILFFFSSCMLLA